MSGTHIYRPSEQGCKQSRPLPADGEQLSVCRNTLCANFGVEPTVRDDASFQRTRDRYRVVGSDPHKKLKCSDCGIGSSLKSNRAAVEEFQRLVAYLAQDGAPRCRKATCVGREPSAYRHGHTADGARRWRCRHCGSTFSQPVAPRWRQRLNHKNELILQLLVNRSPMRRIVEVADVSPMTVYNKLAFFYAQCQRFSARFERTLPSRTFGTLQIETDLQDQLVNWGRDVDRVSTVLRSLTTSESSSQYVLAASPNFDGDVDPGQAERAARERGDFDRDVYHRDCARIWVASDFVQAAKRRALNPRVTRQPLQSPRLDGDEDPFAERWTQRPPARGVLVHQAYQMFGHFLLLRHLLQGAAGIVSCLDPDSGLKQSAISVFRRWILRGRFEAFELSIDKTLTIDAKKHAVQRASNHLKKECGARGLTSFDQTVRELLRERVREGWDIPAPQRWIEHPRASMAEPTLRVLHLTPRPDHTAEQVADLMAQVTLRNTDRFFMVTRRRLSMLERPLRTPSSANRTSHLYSAYNPTVPCRLVQILRVLFNFHFTGGDGKTPAMRLGLTDRPYALAEILDEPRASVMSRR